MPSEQIIGAAFAGGAAIYFGAILAGFSTVVAPRLGRLSRSLPSPQETLPFGAAIRALCNPGSACACGRLLGVLEKTPVLGWLAARGRCGACGALIPLSYPLTEVAGTLLFVVACLWGFWATPLAFIMTALIPSFLLGLAILAAPFWRLPANLAAVVIGAGALLARDAAIPDVLAAFALQLLAIGLIRDLVIPRMRPAATTAILAAGALFTWSSIAPSETPLLAILAAPAAAATAAILVERICRRSSDAQSAPSSCVVDAKLLSSSTTLKS